MYIYAMHELYYYLFLFLYTFNDIFNLKWAQFSEYCHRYTQYIDASKY